MGYLTQTDVRSALLGAGEAVAVQRLRSTAKSSLSERFDIFLSHSFDDAPTIAGIKSILERQGLKVYVDWIDDRQLDRSRISRATADRLRQRMRMSRSLVFATSESSPKSKWMPWELGFFDGYRPGHIVILPLVSHREATFEGQEYLSLYPVAESVGDLRDPRLMIRQLSGGLMPLRYLPYSATH